MLKSYVKEHNGLPTLFVEGKPTAAMAYTTYFEERARYTDFIEAGFKIFFVNISLTMLPINPDTLFTPFTVGVFEDEHKRDYSEFENSVRKIVSECPDAIIFPRIYVSMPKWWIDSHPNSVIATPKGDLREAMFSEEFRCDASKMLAELVGHIKNADYASRIGGWMICGATTQEWYYRGVDGGLGETAKEPYRLWVKENYGDEDAPLPERADYGYKGDPYQRNENAKRYALFCNLKMAETVDIFAKVIKDETNREQVVGAFYGYTFEARIPLFGTYALRKLLVSDNLDFFSSPNAYTRSREFGIDWADMMPVGSIKHHGKLPFIECDIRTCLTGSVQSARPGRYPDDIYTVNGATVWVGPPTPELSREALRKSFAHQLTNGSAIWWFDMWGGWYAHPLLMDEMIKMRGIYEKGLCKKQGLPSSQIVFFADEQSYAGALGGSPQLNAIKETRTAMGSVGAPYDSLDVVDAKDALGNYKAAIFPFSTPSEAGLKAMELCDKLGIPTLKATPDHCELTKEEIREFLQKTDVHLYTDGFDVVYAGCGYVALHSAEGGKKLIRLPQKLEVTHVFGAESFKVCDNEISFDLSPNGTAMFEVKV